MYLLLYYVIVLISWKLLVVVIFVWVGLKIEFWVVLMILLEMIWWLLYLNEGLLIVCFLIVLFIWLVVILVFNIEINLVNELLMIGICCVCFCNFFCNLGIIKLIVFVVLVECGIVLLVVEWVVCKLLFFIGLFNSIWVEV